MFELIDSILNDFRICFERKNTFIWFVIIVFGIIVRSDFRGVTSILGALHIGEESYYTALHFFRSAAYDLEFLKTQWANIVIERFALKKMDDRIFIIGDHTKVAKEAKYMPSVKKHHQESENSSKAEYMFGHDFGTIGILTNAKSMNCVPIDIEIHGGSDEVNSLTHVKLAKTTSNYKLMQMVCKFVGSTKLSIFLLLDAAFSTGEVLTEVYKENTKMGSNNIILISRAKCNYVGFEEPQRIYFRGRKPIYGKRIVLNNLFNTDLDRFTKVKMSIYGKIEDIQYLSVDLYWKPAKRIIRFVLVKTGEKKMVLMCSDLNIQPEKIITAYTYRFKIEISFKNLKHILGAFCYHFWTKSMPKLSKLKTYTDLSDVTKKERITKIASAFRAIHIYAFLSCVSLGILMFLSETVPALVWENYSGWLRTYSQAIPSIETTRETVRNLFYRHFSKVANYQTLRLIQKHQTLKNSNFDETIDNKQVLRYNEPA